MSGNNISELTKTELIEKYKKLEDDYEELSQQYADLDDCYAELEQAIYENEKEGYTEEVKSNILDDFLKELRFSGLCDTEYKRIEKMVNEFNFGRSLV